MPHLQHRRDIPGGHPDVLAGIFQRILQRADGVDHAKHRINAVIVYHANVRRQAACNADDGFVKAFRHFRHAHRDFAMDRLAVDAAFSRDHQIRIGHMVGQV
jgi:hypothetical protein